MSGFVNNYYYGKAGKADFTPESLPDSRVKLFFDMLRIHFGGLCAANLFYLLFCLPAILWTGINASLFMTAEMDLSLASGNLMFYLIGMVPCLTIAGVGAPGLMYVMRNWGAGSAFVPDQRLQGRGQGQLETGHPHRPGKRPITAHQLCGRGVLQPDDAKLHRLGHPGDAGGDDAGALVDDQHADLPNDGHLRHEPEGSDPQCGADRAGTAALVDPVPVGRVSRTGRDRDVRALRVSGRRADLPGGWLRVDGA